MPAVQLIRSFASDAYSLENPLPDLLHTPLGLAVIEIQGTIHAPAGAGSDILVEQHGPPSAIEVGRIEFPLYDGSNVEGPWMKKVYLYVGRHQRLTGEVKKLAKPLASATNLHQDRLNIDAIIKHKILFSSRPEPVGN